MPESCAPEQLPSTELTISQRLMPLEDVGSTIIHWLHFYCKKARNLPFPLGSSISYIEDTLSPWFDPWVASVEEGGLYLLSLADEKINAATDAALKHIPLASVFVVPLHIVLSGLACTKVQSGLEKVRRRGIVGCTADAWVEYEPVVRRKSQGIYKLVNRIPGSCLVVYVLHDIGSPLISTVSEWLIDHSEKGKHQCLLTETSEVSSPIESSTEGLSHLKTIEEHVSGSATDFQERAAEHATESQEDDKKQPTVSPESPKKHVTESQNISAIPTEKSVDSTETSEGSTSEISVPVAEDEKQDSIELGDGKGTDMQVTPLQEEPEEHDEILDLFDTWGLGVQAISPKGLNSLRSLSLQERPDRSSSPKSKSKSFRF